MPSLIDVRAARVLQRRNHGVHVTELEQFVGEGSQMLVKLPALRQLESKISAIKSWNERVANVFHLSSPGDSLVPVTASSCRHMQPENVVFEENLLKYFFIIARMVFFPVVASNSIALLV